jgi:ATP-binding cassette subfamily B protein
MEYFIDAGMVLLIAVGGIYVINGAITIGTFVAFQRYISRLIWPMKAVGWAIYLLQKGLTSMRRIRDVLDTQPDRVESEPKGDTRIIQGDIEFKNLSFSYAGGSKTSLRQINLAISKGMMVAFVGPIGSGKSTLAGLIPGLYPVNRRELFLDGMDINDIPLEIIRENIGFVPQEPFLFSESIYENIAFGLGNDTRPSYSVEDASRIAMVHDEIQLFPNQYDASLGERGINLSGGQKQRLTLARALIRKPPILILDDPFSSVDAEKEETILECLRDERKGLTTIIVTHRLAKIKDVDLIVVFKEGEIMESGTHDRLMGQNGLYAELLKINQLKEELHK